MKRISIIITGILFAAQLSAQVTVTNLRCEMLHNPEGIDVQQPRFSWELNSSLRNVMQQSYQLIVSSSEENLKNGHGDVWNSGVINNSQSVQVIYGGSALQSAKKYFWKVLVNTNKGKAAAAATAFFSTGLFTAEDWGHAKWIGYDKASAWDSITQWSRLSARYLRKEFASNAAVKRATVYICGLGLYELYINGNRIGDQVLAPAPTDYRKAVLYNTYDITTAIKKGNNAVATVLGNGRFFTMRQNYKPAKINTFGFPKLLLKLVIEYTDGSAKTIVSDESWKLNADGPIRSNNEYDGEEYDATKEFPGWNTAKFDDSKWMPAERVDAPAGKLTAQLNEPMLVMGAMKPRSVKAAGGGRYMVDMGENFAGWLCLHNIKGKRGDTIRIRFAESLQSNGALYTANLRDAKVTDVYILKSDAKESWRPSFVYHGFRYAEITGLRFTPGMNHIEGQKIYDALDNTGYFYSSNKTINAVYNNAFRGIASNYKGMPVDCPQRNERQPWLGDRVIGAIGESYLFENAKLYAKWMDDIEQSQTEAGAIPDVAPAFWNYYSDDVTWPAAFITISNNLYNQFADVRPLQKHYAAMKKWMWYMRDKYLVDYIMTRDKYGDWCVPPEDLTLIHAKDSSRLTDGKLIATAYYYKLLSYMQRFAKLTGNDADIKEYGALADRMKEAFQNRFYNPGKYNYSNNTITANLLPLYFGICPDSLKEKVFAHIYHKIHVESNDHISTGLIGTQFLMRGLSEYGYTDLAFTLASNTTYPSYGYMVENGATTIWELWNGNTANPEMNSQNHVMMLGDLLIWYYENLAGIRTDKTDVGFKKIIFKPSLPAGLDSVNASYKSVHGLISSSWKKKDGVFEWTVTVPANTSATVYIPAVSMNAITEAGKDITAAGLQEVKWDKDRAVVKIGSGTYHFSAKLK